MNVSKHPETLVDPIDDSVGVLVSRIAELSHDERNRYVELLGVALNTATNAKDRSVLKSLQEAAKKNAIDSLRKGCLNERFRGWLEVLVVMSSDPRTYKEFCEHRESSWSKRDQMRRNLYYPAFLLVSSILAFFSVGMASSKLFEFAKTLEKPSWNASSLANVDSMAVASAIVPAVISLALGAMIAIRFLGGSVAWSFLGGSLPGLGGVWKWMATAEMLRWVGLLGHARSIPECMRITAMISEYPVNRAIVVRVERGLVEGLDFGRAIGRTSWCPLWVSAILMTSRDLAELTSNCKAMARMLELQAVQRSKLLARVLPLLILGSLLVGIQYTYSTIATNLIVFIRALGS